MNAHEMIPAGSAGAGTVPGQAVEREPLRQTLVWGIAGGILTAGSPLLFWWLPPATVYALGLVLIAGVYIGFAVADGRRKVLIAEVAVTTAFILVAIAGLTGSAWLLVLGFAGHGVKDLWQHRRQYVADTRWWPTFCLLADWIAAAIIAIEIFAGVSFSR
jgi:hypothetical protein